MSLHGEESGNVGRNCRGGVNGEREREAMLKLFAVCGEELNG